MAASEEQSTSPAPSAEFIRQFTSAQRALYLFLLPMVRTPHDADEVLQETNVILLSKWEQFEPGTNFLAWSRAVARFELLRFRRQQGKKAQPLADDVIEMLCVEQEENAPELERRREHLQGCIEELRSRDQQLIRTRYQPGMSGDQVAQQLNRPPNSVYQSLGRIRRTLAECVRRKLAMENIG